MDGRRRVLPLFRHLAAARASSAVQTSVGHSRNRFHSLSAIDQSVFLPKPAPIDAPLFPRQQCRYFSTSGDGGDGDGGGDDESRDVQEQKSAFLRALEGKKHESGNTGSRRKNSAATKSNPNDNSRRRPDQRKHDNDSLLPRRPANRTNTRTKSTGVVSKKLTLDEFFANLEKPRAKGSNPKHGAPPRTPGTRGVRQGGGQGQGQKQSRNVGVGSRKQPRPNARRSPAGGMDSFFDDVDALMERKQREAAGAVPRASERSAENSSSDSLRSAPAFRSSIGDILPPRSPVPIAASAFGDDEGPRNFEGLGFGVESWDQYTELLEEIMEGRKFLAKLRKRKTKTAEEEDEEEKNRQVIQVVEWLRSEQPCVETDLPTLDAALKGEDRIDEANSNIKDSDSDSDSVTEETIAVGIDSDRSKHFREELVAQNERFMKETGWTKGQYDVATGALVALGGLCAKRCMASPLDVAWSKLKELGYPMRSKDVLHNYLYVSSTFSLPKRRATLRDDETWNLGIFGDENVGDNGEGGGTRAPESILDFLNKPPGSSSFGNVYRNGGEINDEIDLSAEVALCHDFFHEATEQSIGIHVRRLVHLGKANDAEKLLDASMKSNDLRLRTYGPIYQAYLDQGDVSSAFQLFVKMKGAENVLLQTETYIQLIACIAENGYFRSDAKEIDGIEELEYKKYHGPELFNVLASELAEHSIEITSASAKRLYNAFQRGFEGNNSKANLKQLHLLESLRTDNRLAQTDELVVSRVQIDESTGKCPRSGSQLRLINLDSAQKKQFQDGLLYLVSSSYQERHRNAPKVNVAEKLKKFGDWLQNRTGKPFTAIIDGPNIAYYMQNFQQGTFNYHQIKFVSDALENMGENVLVVLPKKYTYDSFSIQIGGRTVKQTLSPTEKEIRDDLLANGKACVVPVGSLDDYYWMFASVSMEEEFVPPDNPDGRWPGNRPMLISNDKLRDHKMSLLEPRLFRRWYSNFLVNFTFSAFVNDECVDREIGFRTADFYSREIQGNADGNGTVWHFPVKDWNENESMCIRIANKKAD